MVQQQDFENASSALTKLGFTVAHLPSAGGFLRRNNVTLLIGLPKGREEVAVRALRSSCKKRVEYLASPLPNTANLLPKPTPITVGGAMIFVCEVESCDEF